MKQESFLKGTVILIAANTISKILGAILKIPLTYILGEEGMAIYQTAFSVYIMLLSFIISGMPFAISKLIAELIAKEKYADIHLVMRISTAIMCILGFSGSVIMYFAADFFAYAMKDPKAVTAIQAISPAIFFVALGAAYKSCFQGYSHMTPTAVSQVIEAFIKLIVGYSLAKWFSSFAVRYSSAAAIFGVTIGEIFATLILFLLYIPYKKDFRSFHGNRSSAHDILSAILVIAVPMTLTSTVSGSLSLLETSIIRNRLTNIVFSEESARSFLLRYSGYTNIFDNLLADKQLGFDGARWLYGAYSGYAMTVFNLPVGILAAFGVSVLPIVTRALALEDYKLLDTTVQSALKIVLIIAIPCSFMLMMFSGQILDILFSNTASAYMLSCMAPMLVLIATEQLISSLLYSSGKIFTPFLFGIIALTVKIILSYILIHCPQLNIIGVIISSFAAITIQLILNIASLKKHFHIRLISIGILVKIIVSSLLMTVTAHFFYNPMCILLRSDMLGFFAAAAAALITYVLSVFLCGLISKKEIMRL
ncbi:MAG: polysaccharide biosynthesis protein [Firmicutes bacterium]|nr:polysaccharide biosynthesis protein [Bacillota bacterium]